MNKLKIAVSTAVLISSMSMAIAQVGSATGTNGALDNGHPTGAAAATTATGATGAMDTEHRPATGAGSNMPMDHEKSPMHKGSMDAEHVSTTGAASDMSMKHEKGSMHMGKMGMKAMDTNHDGMISKDEFMTYHEAMYDHMTKNKDGMVDMNAMGKMSKHKAK